MFTVKIEGVDVEDNVMSSCHIDQDGNKINYAALYQKYCQSKDFIEGYKTIKNGKRQKKSVVDRNFFHSLHRTKPHFENLAYKVTGFEKGLKNGMRGHYCYQADPNLAVGKVAARCVWCHCQECNKQLELDWRLQTLFHDQPRYKQNKDYMLWLCLKERMIGNY